MAIDPTQQKQPSQPQDQDQNRNDPAIDPQNPDHELGKGTQYEQASAGAASQSQNNGAPDKPQGQPDTQFEQNQQSGGNTFTPDYEPEEKPAVQRNPQPTRGEDADIETDGG